MEVARGWLRPGKGVKWGRVQEEMEQLAGVLYLVGAALRGLRVQAVPLTLAVLRAQGEGVLRGEGEGAQAQLPAFGLLLVLLVAV